MAVTTDPRKEQNQRKFAMQLRRLIWAQAVPIGGLICLLAGWLPLPDGILSIVILCIALLAWAAFCIVNCACPACGEQVGYVFAVRFCPACGEQLRQVAQPSRPLQSMSGGPARSASAVDSGPAARG